MYLTLPVKDVAKLASISNNGYSALNACVMVLRRKNPKTPYQPTKLYSILTSKFLHYCWRYTGRIDGIKSNHRGLLQP